MARASCERIRYSNVSLEEKVEIVSFNNAPDVYDDCCYCRWCICFKKQKDVSRIVYVDNKVFSEEELVEECVYPDNTVISSKYTLLTFLPKNLFEQLQRIANFYFLCVACIQVSLRAEGDKKEFVIDTPVTPLTSILPLCFVVAVTAIKQGYEDWLRHKADNEVNLRHTVVIRNGVEVSVKAMDVKVGDIVKVKKNEEFPCDIIMLSSEDPHGQCFVTTTNLDGETSLKTFSSLNETRTFMNPELLGTLKARITCMPQVTDLYRFEGIMEFDTGTESRALGPENLLLRGARLKNTEYIYGCAVYTGRDTKMTLNSKSKKTKFSRVERKMNAYLLVFLVILLVESVISTVLMYLFEGRHGVPWYVPKDKTKVQALKAVEHSLAFMVLYNYIIPISLYVTVEMQKFLGSLFFGMDDEMYDPSIDERAQANTSDLNEELGQVEYLFTDKTGTITENVMVFRKCCIGKRRFEIMDEIFFEKMDTEPSSLTDVLYFSDEMYEFFKVLALCHTVRLENEKQLTRLSTIMLNTAIKKYEVHASSPDEKALVAACFNLGIIYHGARDNILTVSFHSNICQFKLLHLLPFDSIRKRMSIIIEDDRGEYFLLCKGAEIAMLDRTDAGDVDTIQNIVTEYAQLGLRTLTIAQRKLSEQEYIEYDQMLTTARRSMVSRDILLAGAYDTIEQKLTLLGATAVEDKLQDQVPQTIEALRMAGIKVWVLTGDKEETAVNISHSAGHFNSDMHELRLTHVNSEEECEPQLEELIVQTSPPYKKGDYAFIIDGQSLAFALKFNKKMLLNLCSRCVAVLCCRMSPIQKAEVVAMVKHSPHRPVTAAIGDGANDVSMIQEADVGLGIMGKEGRQAVRNSDYAFGKFKFLRRALLLHGHLYYHRIAVLVQYFFYKNVAWITAQVFYAFYTSFSQQSLFDPFYLMFYNLSFTSLPILIFGLFEQHITKDELLNNPELYRRISRNATLSWFEFLRWNCLGLWHCVVIFFGIVLLQKSGVSLFESGKMIGNYDMGTLIVFSCVATVNIKLLLETYYWCLPTFIAVFITVVGIIVLAGFYSNIYLPPSMVSQKDLYKAIGQLYTTPTTWLAMVLFVFTALLPDIIFRVIRDTSNSSQYGHYCKRAQTVSMLVSIFKNETLRCDHIFHYHLTFAPDFILFTATTLVSREIRLRSIPYSEILHRSIVEGRQSLEGIELQPSTRRSSCSTTLSGLDNPIISLSDENLPSIGAHNEFTGQDIPEKATTSRIHSTNSEFTVEYPQGSSAATRYSTGLRQAIGDNSKNDTFEHKSTSNILHSHDFTVHSYPSDDELLRPVESSGISNSSSLRSAFLNDSTNTQNIEQTNVNQICPSSHSDDFSDNKTCISPPAVSENKHFLTAPTQPLNFVRNTINEQPYTNITPFSPSPSHAISAHHNTEPSLAHVTVPRNPFTSISENEYTNIHFSQSSAL